MDYQDNKSSKSRSDNCVFDRLSPLPNDVLHRILSFLDFLDVVRTCVLSRRWRNVWMSVKCLNFDMNWFEERNEFWDSIMWFLLLRDESAIRRINITFDHSMIVQLNAFLCFAARKKVQELCFHSGDYTNKDLNFPDELCETLKSLTLKFRENISLRVAKSFSSLKSLFLSGVFISSDAAEKLFSGCVELEDLHLEDVNVKDVEIISISADKLKNLTISNMYRDGNFLLVSSFHCKLNIRAPNLLSFSYFGPMLYGFAFLDTVSLRHVSIRILYINQQDQVQWGRENISPLASKFVGLNHAKNLTLSSLVVKYFSPTHFDPLGVTFILDNLNYLKLGLRCKVETLAIRFPEVRWFSPKRQSNTTGILFFCHFSVF
ncbi:hypothetical protein ACJIZ3_021513 [Penstemon smallii]|uniref:F-box domain-containing protein n=1 Tax=Penstemon smallii TaxID=265156 RepID=A0ABD3SLM9_9LAMI